MRVERTVRRWLFTVLVLALAASLMMVSPPHAVAEPENTGVLISELSNSGPDSHSDNFIELQNFGDEAVDISGWRVHRCTGTGSRANDIQGAPFDDVVLEPGEIFLLAHEDSTMVDRADMLYPVSLANAGFGAWLEDDDFNRIDSVSVMAEPSDSDCGVDGPANDLDNRLGESWQRVDTTGDDEADFIKAVRTPGEPNATEPSPGPQPDDVLISELTSGGPEGNSDNFVELANYGDDPVDISGWAIHRCTAVGRGAVEPQATVPDGTTLDPGDVFVAAHESVSGDVPDVRYEISLAGTGFGIAIEDADGIVRDAVGVYEREFIHEPPVDSSCTQGTALPNRLDYGWGHSYQRDGFTHDNSQDFVVGQRTMGELTEPEPIEEEDDFTFGPVRISELANGLVPEGEENFFELANYGDEAVDLEGWEIYRCTAAYRRAPEPQVEPISGVVLEPGDTFLAVREGTPLHDAGDYDAAYTTSFAEDGFGLMVLDGDGVVVDSVGIYQPVGTVGEGGYSPCTKGLSAANTLDTAVGRSYQRVDSTGVDSVDLVSWPQTPGELAEDIHQPGDYPDEDLEPVDADPLPHAERPELVAPADGSTGWDDLVDLEFKGAHTTGDAVEVAAYGAERLDLGDASETHSGVSDDAPPLERFPDAEQVEYPAEGVEPLSTEAAEGFPFHRYELVLDEVPSGPVEVTWSGRSVNTNELQLYVWSGAAGAWELLDTGGGIRRGDITMIGEVDEAHIGDDGSVGFLVQDGPAVGGGFSDEDSEPNATFKDPAEFDFSLGYVTDTQWLSEGFHEVYAEMNRWLVTNADARRIAYTTHTGDVIESWTRGTHPPPRALHEFDVASDIQEILEDADHPHGVLPGNHDNRWGRDNTFFNATFPTSRYADRSWFGGSWRADTDPEDKHSHYDLLEIEGAPFIIVNIGYFGGDEAIEWANDVLAEYPDHNAILATHKHIDEHGERGTPANDRWTSEGQRFWDEIVLPNDHVFMVVSGHWHGVALNVNEDVDGDGRTVIEMMADYQNFEREGRRDTGFMRLLQFDLDAAQMAVNTYSPTLDEYHSWPYDPDERYNNDPGIDEFTLDVDLNDRYDKRVEVDQIGLQAPSAVIGTVAVADGEEGAVTWADLTPDTTYSWFTEATDPNTSTSARSELRTFTVTGSDDPPPGDPVELVVTPSAPTIGVDGAVQLSATAVYEDDSEQPVTDGADWASDDTEVAAVDDAGVVTGVAEGTVEVTATFEDLSDSATVTVDPEVEPGPVGLERISAEPGRVEVAIAASQHRFDDGEADAVVLARADEYPDALAGTTLAAEHDAPLLLTSSDVLLDNVADEISRVLGDDGAVYLTGGTEALDETVEDAVDVLDYETTRLGGETRFETAGLIAEALGDRSQVLVTTGLDFPDALTAGAAAAAHDGVVLLSAGDDAHEVVDDYLGAFDGDVSAVGGPATRAYPDAEPVMGATRDETAVAVAEAFFDEPVAFGVSRRDDYPDALSGGAHIAAYGGPLLLSYTDDVPDETAGWLQATGATGGFVYGGTAAISEDTFDELEDLAGFGDDNDNNNDGE